MPYFIDKSDELAEMIKQKRITSIRESAEQQEAKATGRCLFCHEFVEDGRRWCDSDCRDDWEAERRMEGIRRR